MTAFGIGFGMLAFAALGDPFVVNGAVIFKTHLPLALLGGGILFTGAYLWALEGPGGYHIHLDEKGTATTVRH
jgi:cytochrome c oxidase subunit 1